MTLRVLKDLQGPILVFSLCTAKPLSFDKLFNMSAECPCFLRAAWFCVPSLLHLARSYLDICRMVMETNWEQNEHQTCCEVPQILQGTSETSDFIDIHWLHVSHPTTSSDIYVMQHFKFKILFCVLNGCIWPDCTEVGMSCRTRHFDLLTYVLLPLCQTLYEQTWPRASKECESVCACRVSCTPSYF